MVSKIVLFIGLVICLGLSVVTVADAQSSLRVDSVILSEVTVMLPCPPGTYQKVTQCRDGMSVQVAAAISGRRSRDVERSILSKVISGGRIVAGTKKTEFAWDLTGARAGTYTLTVGIAGHKKPGEVINSRTVSVVVSDCDGCRIVDECPQISVTGPAGITRPGEKMTFTANIVGTAAEVTYTWTVSAGTITSGQGTPSIEVDTRDVADRATITATITIKGLGSVCKNTASETGEVVAIFER